MSKGRGRSGEGNEEGGGYMGGGWEIKYIIFLELDSCWQPHCLATRLSTRTS